MIKGREKGSSDYKVIGSAFCVASFDKAVLLITAGHNLEEIYGLEKSKFSSAPSCVFPFEKPKDLKKWDIFILFWDDHNELHECELLNMTSWKAYDVACIWVKKPESLKSSFAKFKIDTNPPPKDKKVCMLGFSNIGTNQNMVWYSQHNKIGRVKRIFHQNIGIGRKAAIQPYIQTDIPIPSGCSGAPLIDLETSCVVGIASHDSGNSSASAEATGENSVFVPILPALGICLPKEIILIENDRKISNGFDLVRSSIIDDRSKCSDHIQIGTMKPNGLAVNFKWTYFADLEEYVSN